MFKRARSARLVPVRFTALLAGGSIGLLLGASYVGLLTSFGDLTTSLRTSAQAVTAGALALGIVGFGVVMPSLSWTRRKPWSERRRFLAVAGMAFLALLVLSVLIDALTGSRGLAMQIFLVAGVVCAVPAWLLARIFTRHPRAACTVLIVTGVIAAAGAATIPLS